MQRFLKWISEDERYIMVLAYALAGLSAKISYAVAEPAFGQDLALACVIAALLSPWAWGKVVRMFGSDGWSWGQIAPAIALGVIVTGTDLFTNFQGVGTNRTVEFQRVAHVNDGIDRNVDAIDSAKQRRDMLMRTRDTVMTRINDIKAANDGWIVGASYEGLVAQMDGLRAERHDGCGAGTQGRGKGSCWDYTKQCVETDGPKTEAFCQRYTELSTQVGALKDYNAQWEELDKLDKQLAAIDKLTDDKAMVLAEKPKEVSVGRVQAANAAWVFDGFNLNPSEETLATADKSISFYYALFLTFAAMFVMITREIILGMQGKDRPHLNISSMMAPPPPPQPMTTDQKALAQLNQAPQTIVLNNTDDTVRQTFSSIWQRANALAA